jgi:hypothetical protein
MVGPIAAIAVLMSVESGSLRSKVRRIVAAGRAGEAEDDAVKSSALWILSGTFRLARRRGWPSVFVTLSAFGVVIIATVLTSGAVVNGPALQSARVLTVGTDVVLLAASVFAAVSAVAYRRWERRYLLAIITVRVSRVPLGLPGARYAVIAGRRHVTCWREAKRTWREGQLSGRQDAVDVRPSDVLAEGGQVLGPYLENPSVV